MGKAPLSMRVRVGGPDGIVHLFKGRVANTLSLLKMAGERGITPIEHPQPRTSDYVFKLRRAGVSIETIMEPHGGPFAGEHARYVLRSPIEVISEVRA
ncbi:winged helix domain-containing protein [Labrys sp. ZIDIC5]|uniref:winged helix domain-containing protein n=1 Tax=Labrys sedimenti TaxID=3106036 RepID=UPI002ACA6BC2|nr:hypothetical protein [Labrys sp. ZIDIC5]MDZ5448613.1 hypothetical protein [Labrys sp. ZIDIC5]